MHIKALVSPIALASALAISGGVFAQDATTEANASAEMMIGDQTVAAEDVAAVQNFCADLELDDSGSSVSGISPSMESDAEADDEDAQDAAQDAQSELVNIDFDTITLEQCEEGGFLDGEMTMETEVEAPAM